MGYIQENGIRAICFDIDGTFYPKWKMDIRLFKASIFHLPFARRYNNSRKMIRALDGLNDAPVLSYDEISKRGAMLCLGDDLPDSQRKFRDKEKHIFHDYYLKAYRNIEPAKNVLDALSIARDEGMRMAALSDFPIGVKLKAMGIDEYMDFAISSEELGHFKPSMTPFRVLCEKLGIRPEEILYVGDSYRKDIIGANNAGMHTCLIFSKERKEYTKADLCMASWRDFIERVL